MAETEYTEIELARSPRGGLWDPPDRELLDVKLAILQALKAKSVSVQPFAEKLLVFGGSGLLERPDVHVTDQLATSRLLGEYGTHFLSDIRTHTLDVSAARMFVTGYDPDSWSSVRLVGEVTLAEERGQEALSAMRMMLETMRARYEALEVAYKQLLTRVVTTQELSTAEREETIAAIKPAVEQELDNEKWDFRTVDGIARAVDAPTDCVEELFERYPSMVRWVPAVDENGHLLLVSAKRPVTKRERFLRIRSALTKTLS